MYTAIFLTEGWQGAAWERWDEGLTGCDKFRKIQT